MEETRIGVIRDVYPGGLVFYHEGRGEAGYPVQCDIDPKSVIGKKAEVTFKSQNPDNDGLGYLIVTSILIL